MAEDPDPAVEPPTEAGGKGKTPPAGEGQEPEGLRNMQAGTLVDEPEGQEPPEGRTYSQSYVKQLRKENAERREHEAELEAKLKEREDADKTEVEREREARETAEKERDELKLGQVRLEVAGESGLPANAVQFLTGTTREEIEHRAEELGKLLKQGKPVAGFDGGARPKAPAVAKPPEVAHNELLLRAIGRNPEERAS